MGNRTEELVRQVYGDTDSDDGASKCDSIEDCLDDDDESFHGSEASSSNQTSDTSRQLYRRFAYFETLSVRACRVLVILLLLIAGIVVSAGTYILLSQRSYSVYHTQYVMFSQTIAETAFHQVTSMIESFATLSDTLEASARKENMTWPFVTLDKQPFEVLGQQVRTDSGVEFLAFAPLVTEANRQAWINYSFENSFWYNQSRRIAGMYENDILDNEDNADEVNADDDDAAGELYKSNKTFATDLHRMSGVSLHNETLPHAPIWQASPPPFDPEFVNYNLLGTVWYNGMLPALQVIRNGLFSSVYNLTVLSGVTMSKHAHKVLHEQYDAAELLETSYDHTQEEHQADKYYLHPHSALVYPIFDSRSNAGKKVTAGTTSNYSTDDDFVGLLLGIVPWDRYISGLLPDGVEDIMCVLVNDCGQAYSFMLKGHLSLYLGLGDFHDERFEDTLREVQLYNYSDSNITFGGHCGYSLKVYSTQSFKDSVTDSTAVTFTIVVASIFAVIILTFLCYDYLARRRNKKVTHAAARTDKILSTLFPKNVRSRLFDVHDLIPHTSTKNLDGKTAGRGFAPIAKSRLRTFLDTGEDASLMLNDELGFGGKPIADLFPETTVMFLDIAGFTAWSSVREPAQVFTLLETLYRAFDDIAAKRKVFKVETIGDCYVAVTGLPDPRRDHAVAMARFARDCMSKMQFLTKRLEVSLGPDTGDLMMRAGLHSGPVTAGVLRGERSRFQLFGDTMNTASRMESTGQKGRIQCSQDTADLLIQAGKKDWLTERKDKVVAKGKGEMQTYWLESGVQRPASNSSGNSGDVANVEALEAKAEKVKSKHHASADELSAEKTRRLIDWNTEVLLRLLKQIVAKRRAKVFVGAPPTFDERTLMNNPAVTGKTVINEVKEIVNLPGYSARAVANLVDPESIVLPQNVVEQLYDYVTNIAALYNNNPFHNFEHASHVTMSVVKLLSRIVAPAEIESDENLGATGRALHDHTYGITSDPLTQFACVFSALIHDVDHAGVPNAQLVNEKTFTAEYYNGTSVAEQNSVDLAFQVLMDDSFHDLRRTIYATEKEFFRFRQLVVNSVMATDIVDKELKALRNARWAKAFSENAAEQENSRDAVNRKATIVIEHLIQASDIAHTMQHWHIYRKWNERFFSECYKAYIEGRAEKDPSESWYGGEIGFYDFYIIPLAKKLKDCGVFGVSSDEYLNYAVRNRKEWEERGKAIVSEMVEKVRKQYHTATVSNQDSKPEEAEPTKCSL